MGNVVSIKDEKSRQKNVFTLDVSVSAAQRHKVQSL